MHFEVTEYQTLEVNLNRPVNDYSSNEQASVLNYLAQEETTLKFLEESHFRALLLMHCFQIADRYRMCF